MLDFLIHVVTGFSVLVSVVFLLIVIVAMAMWKDGILMKAVFGTAFVIFTSYMIGARMWGAW